MSLCRALPAIFLLTITAAVGRAAENAEKPIVGLIPKAQKPIAMDGKLDDWQGYLWDDDNLYIGLRALDQKPWHNGTAVWDGDGSEFYLDTRRGDELGAKEFSPGSLHMFWTPFTKSDIASRWQIRDRIPAFKDLKLQGVQIIGQKTSWGWTAEFKLPWANFPNFKAKADEVIGIDCELCSSDGGHRVDRTFVYSSPADVGSPSAFGRVKLVDQIEPGDAKPFGRVLLPMSLTKSGNYDWLYATACISPTISGEVAKIEGKLSGRSVKKPKEAASVEMKTLEGSGFEMWHGSLELFDLPAGTDTVELSALDKDGKVITTHSERVLQSARGK
jgi:hypothetical protein